MLHPISANAQLPYLLAQIQEKRVFQGLVSVEPLILVSAKHPDHTAMQQTMCANVRQLWRHVVGQRTLVIVELANAVQAVRVVIQAKPAVPDLVNVELQILV